jgi:hypothetical protein
MRIVCIDGGKAELYFALLMKAPRLRGLRRQTQTFV